MREVFTHEKKLDNASFLFCPVFSYDKKLQKHSLYDFFAAAYACKYIDTLRLLWYLYLQANKRMIFLKNCKDLKAINLYK
jgi:hypothetical protein